MSVMLTEVSTSDKKKEKPTGMMYLLISGEFESKEHLYKTLEDLYHNFTSTHETALALLEDRNSPMKSMDVVHNILDLSRRVGCLITFCKCFLLKRILKEDGITINASLAQLLSDIAHYLMNLIKACTDQNVNELKMFPGRALTERVCKAYCEPPPIYCCNQMIIRYDLMIEFLDICLHHLDLPRLDHTFLDITYENKVTLIKEFNFLKNYLELSTNAQSHCQDLLIAVENVAYQMARHIYVHQMCDNSMVSECGYDWRKDTRSEFRIGVFKALVLQSPPVMSDELVVEYVKYVQEHLLDLQWNKAIILFATFKSQLWILHEGISFLLHLLISYPPKHNSQQEMLSDTRLHFQDLVRNVGSVVCSCLENPHEIEELSLKILYLIEKIDVIKGEIIKYICCMVLRETEQEPPKKDQLASLTILLKKLKEFMGKTGCIITWKDHENLVLFIFYLFQNDIRGDNCTSDEEFSQYTVKFEAAVINHGELNEVLMSAQVAAFNMSLRRYGRICWCELYLGTIERVDMHMCVGILKAFGWSSTTPLTDEFLIAYGECVQDSLIELLRYDAFDPLKDQLYILHQGISFLGHLLTSYMDEQEKLSGIKAVFQELVRSVGFVICSSINNRANGDTDMQ